MSRPKLARSVVDTCADCGAVDPTWASINKGILICDECCSVHRTLGRHISHVKSLRKGTWIPSQLAMVHALHSNGANSIWEHSLLDPSHSKSGRKKPQPRDPVKPTKADFIRTKHQLLGFVHRPNNNNNNNIINSIATAIKPAGDEKNDASSEAGCDPETSAAADASKQLHSSVRTANLETSLRLLSCGADSNFLHPEKGTCPLHVAAGAGQASQVELLLVYGADPGGLDTAGKTPIDHASDAGYKDVAYRLLESQYELTDRLSAYLCERKPDHSAGQHFLIPEMADSLESNSEAAKAAKRKLQMLPNYLFEEMAMDAYDEVDRRETEQYWIALQGTNAAHQTAVPFLPVHAELSAGRNQARQKLGRLNAREFAIFLIDLLGEAKRRHLGTHLAIAGRDSRILRDFPGSHGLREHADYDEPLYDSVASEASEEEFGPSAVQLRGTSAVPSVEAYRDIKEQLALSNRRMQELLASNAGMQSQIGQLQSMVQSLVQENQQLRTTTTAQQQQNSPVSLPPTAGSQSTPSTPTGNVNSNVANGPTPPKVQQTSQEEPASAASGSGPGGVILRGSKIAAARHFSMYEPREGGPRSNAAAVQQQQQPQQRPVVNKALAEEVIRRTNLITRRIQEVFRAVQERRLQDQVEPAGGRTLESVLSVVALVQPGATEEVRSCLHLLNTSAVRLQAECSDAAQLPAVSSPASSASAGSSSAEPPLPPAMIAATQRIIQGAYDVAKATKQLVTLFQ